MKVRNFCVTLVALSLTLGTSFPQEPAWWAEYGIKNSNAANNRGPANIGQAKNMVKQALEVIRLKDADLASKIETSVLAVLGENGLEVPPQKTQQWRDSQKAPLLVGQLKAIAKPFYDEIHAIDPTWLTSERDRLQTASENSIYPWTEVTTDDQNYAIANLGQLKATFALRLAALPPPFPDEDGDGLSDEWEILYDLNPSRKDSDSNDVFDGDEDLDNDGLSNRDEFLAGSNPTVSDTDGDGLSDSQEIEKGLNPLNKDTDSDEMEDGWEDYYGFPAKDGTKNLTSKKGPDDDLDGDGILNKSEAAAGGIPTCPNDCIDVNIEGGKVTFNWFGKLNIFYRVEFSRNLQDWTLLNWSRGGENKGIKVTINELADPVPPSGFLRLISSNVDPSVEQDIDGNALPDWWEYTHFQMIGIDPDSNSDGDSLTALQEYLAGTNPNDEDSDNDDVYDDFEYNNGLNPNDPSDVNTTTDDGDWLTPLEEFNLGLSARPRLDRNGDGIGDVDLGGDDDIDDDGWLDYLEAGLLNADHQDSFNRVWDVLPWTDLDGDGFSNAAELAHNSDPLDETSPNTAIYEPLIHLDAKELSSGDLSSWENTGFLKGEFVPVGSTPPVVTAGSQPSVKFAAGVPDALEGPFQPSWLTGSGSRTVVAWVRNASVAEDEDDVLVSWGKQFGDSPTSTLFSARFGGGSTTSALKISGDQNGGGFTWPKTQPTPENQNPLTNQNPPTNKWCFVVYRYDSANRNLTIFRDFSSALIRESFTFETAVFDSNGTPLKMLLGGEHSSSATTSDSVVSAITTSLEIGVLQVFGEALPMVKLQELYNEHRDTYAGALLADADSDGLPDSFEDLIGTLRAGDDSADSDQDGISDLVEFNAGSNPLDYFNGRAHYLDVVGGESQQIPFQNGVTLPIVFQVHFLNDALGELTPAAKAPVSVKIIGGADQGSLREVTLGDSTGGQSGSVLHGLRADDRGRVKVRFYSGE